MQIHIYIRNHELCQGCISLSKRMLVLCILIKLRMPCTVLAFLIMLAMKEHYSDYNMIYSANTTLGGLVQKERLAYVPFLSMLITLPLYYNH